MEGVNQTELVPEGRNEVVDGLDFYLGERRWTVVGLGAGVVI